MQVPQNGILVDSVLDVDAIVIFQCFGRDKEASPLIALSQTMISYLDIAD